MWNPARQTRSALAFSMAAAVAFLGSAVLLKARGGFPMPPGGAAAAAPPGMLLLAVVILLGASGVILVAMAVTELLDLHRREPSAR